MAIKTKDEIINQLKTKFGEESDDEVIGILEDITDTIDDYNTRLSDSTDWKTKFEDNDKEWRKKYTDRFYNKESQPDPNTGSDSEQHPEKPKTFDDLFKE